MSTSDRVLDLYARRRQAQQPGSERAQHRRELAGKLSARQRIELLVDKGSFLELDEFGLSPLADPEDKEPAYGDGVVARSARVHGRPITGYAQDATVLGGSLGVMHGHKMRKVVELTGRIGCPVVAISDSAGARLQEGVDGLSQMYVTGPEVIERALGHRPSYEELGGARLCCEVTGTAHYLGSDEHDAIDWVRTLLAYLPVNNRDGAPHFAGVRPARFTPEDLALDEIVPDSSTAGFDMEVVVRTVLDDGDFLEISELYGRALMVGFGCIDGSTVGVVASRPTHIGGALDGDTSDKTARFIRFCEAMGLPVLTLLDVPGFLPGVEQEHTSILTRGAKLLYAYAEATVPLVTVVLRKAWCGHQPGLADRGDRHHGSGVRGGAAARCGPRRHQGRRAGGAAAELVERYRARQGTPYAAAARGYVDRVIAPHETRLTVAAALRMLRTKQVDVPAKKHGNIPL